MPKGRGQYATITIKQLTCGRVFSGSTRQVEKIAQLHAKGCTDCQKCKYVDVRTAKAAPESTQNELVAHVVAGITN